MFNPPVSDATPELMLSYAPSAACTKASSYRIAIVYDNRQWQCWCPERQLYSCQNLLGVEQQITRSLAYIKEKGGA